MNSKRILSYLLEQANSFVRMIGMITIVSFLVDHWPRATYTVIAAAGIGALVWFFLWIFFVRPFCAAWKGEPK